MSAIANITRPTPTNAYRRKTLVSPTGMNGQLAKRKLNPSAPILSPSGTMNPTTTTKLTNTFKSSGIPSGTSKTLKRSQGSRSLLPGPNTVPSAPSAAGTPLGPIPTPPSAPPAMAATNQQIQNLLSAYPPDLQVRFAKDPNALLAYPPDLFKRFTYDQVLGLPSIQGLPPIAIPAPIPPIDPKTIQPNDPNYLQYLQNTNQPVSMPNSFLPVYFYPPSGQLVVAPSPSTGMRGVTGNPDQMYEFLKNEYARVGDRNNQLRYQAAMQQYQLALIARHKQINQMFAQFVREQERREAEQRRQENLAANAAYEQQKMLLKQQRNSLKARPRQNSPLLQRGRQLTNMSGRTVAQNQAMMPKPKGILGSIGSFFGRGQTRRQTRRR